MPFRLKSVAAALLCLLATAGGVSAKEPAATVATVNGSAITAEELDREFSLLEQRMARQGRSLSAPEFEEARDKVLENLINVELLAQESRKQGIQVEDADVEQQFDAFRGRFGSDAEFDKALSEMDLTRDEIRGKIRDTLGIRKLIAAQVQDGVTVSDEELRSFYRENQAVFQEPEKVRARHILIKVDDNTDKKKAKQSIEKARKRVAQGEDFGDVARQVSEGPSSEKGGDLGFFGRGQMVKPFEEAAFSLETGALSEVVETRFGYHVLQVTDRQAEKNLAFDEVKDRLEQVLMREKTREGTEQYIDALRSTAKIERF